MSQFDAQEIGRLLVETIRDDVAARCIYVQAGRDALEVWVLLEPIGVDAEDRFYEAGAALQRAFPDVVIRFHLVNPRLFAPDINLPGDVIPSGAIAIPLQP
jgi:hypothetical protein